MTFENASDILNSWEGGVSVYNYSKLLGAMREKGMSQDQLAHEIKVNPSTLNAKLKNNSQFKQQEILDIMQALSLPITEIQLYFFAH